MAFQNWFHNDPKVANSQAAKDVVKESKRTKFRDLIDKHSPKGALPDKHEMDKATGKREMRKQVAEATKEKVAKRALNIREKMKCG